MGRPKKIKKLKDLDLHSLTEKDETNSELSEEQREIIKEKVTRNETQRDDTTRLLEGKNSSWRNLNVVQKEEIITEWYINGGVVYGRRYKRTELAELLGVDSLKLTKILERIEEGFTNVCRTKEAVREHISATVGKFSQQLLYDRSLAVRLVESFERQTEKVMTEIDELEDSLNTSDLKLLDVKIISNKLNNRTSFLRSLNIQRVESLRVLIESSESMNRFLGLFAGKGQRLEPLEGGNQDSANSVPSNELVNRLEAVRIISENSAPILPSQNSTDFAPRNPDNGFEELENGRPENQES